MNPTMGVCVWGYKKWMFPKNNGYPKWMDGLFHGKSLLKWMIWVYPQFLETPIHIYIMCIYIYILYKLGCKLHPGCHSLVPQDPKKGSQVILPSVRRGDLHPRSPNWRNTKIYCFLTVNWSFPTCSRPSF